MLMPLGTRGVARRTPNLFLDFLWTYSFRSAARPPAQVAWARFFHPRAFWEAGGRSRTFRPSRMRRGRHRL